MDRKPAVVFIICQIAEKVKELGIKNRDNEIKSVISIADDDKQCCFPCSNRFQIHFVIRHQITKFFDIKGSQASTAGNQNGFCCLAGSQLVFFVLTYSKVIRFIVFQFFKQQVNGIFEVFVILTGFTSIDQFQKCGEVLFFFRSFIPDQANQSTVIKPFCFDPEIFIGFFTFTFGIGNNGINKL